MDAGAVPASSTKENAPILAIGAFSFWLMRAAAREVEDSQWLSEQSLLDRSEWALAPEWSKRERTRQLHIKRNNRLRGTVVSSVEFFGNTFYFWFLYNFFTQELPL